MLDREELKELRILLLIAGGFLAGLLFLFFLIATDV